MRNLETEISMWPDELRAGTLPTVCVKTGRPAPHWYRFGFAAGADGLATSFLVGPMLMCAAPGAIAAQLPLANGPRYKLAALTTAYSLGFTGFVTAVLLPRFVPDAPRLPLSVLAIAGVAVAISMYALYFVETSFGQVHRTPSGQQWVRLRQVHPNFIAAVEAWRAVRSAAQLDPGRYSGDLRWRWDGNRWVSTALPNADVQILPAGRLAWWQVVPGMVVVVVLLGILAWTQFHS